MATHTARATWRGDTDTGEGAVEIGAQSLSYTYAARFGTGPGESPEALMGAALAADFAMSLAEALAHRGYGPRALDVRSTVYLEEDLEGGYEINRIVLHCEADVSTIDDATFLRLAHQAKQTCPIARLFKKGVKIDLEAEVLEAV